MSKLVYYNSTFENNCHVVNIPVYRCLFAKAGKTYFYFSVVKKNAFRWWWHAIFTFPNSYAYPCFECIDLPNVCVFV
jgi:hypothetical protein